MSLRADPAALKSSAGETGLDDTNRKSYRGQGGARAVPAPPVAVERILPGKVAEPLFREHEARYLFASRFVRDKQVLDVACGVGIGTHCLLNAGARSSLGFDIDNGAIDYAKAAYKDCVFALCDAINLCLPDSSVDVVVSFETIEHLRDQLKFLLECKRVLRPGGILVCSTPNRAIFRWQKRNPYHVREFSVMEFAHLVGTAFSDVRLYAQSNRIYVPYVARKLLSGLLDELQLKSLTKRILGWNPAPLALRTEFDGNQGNWHSEIEPYLATPLVQPMYVIAVGRRPPG